MISKYLWLICFLIFFLIYIGFALSPTKADIEPQIFDEYSFEDLKFKSNNKVKKVFFVTITGYSSSYDETDDTPFITATGDFVKEGVVATNFLPFGTKIKIPSLYGDKIFIVKDRMHKRYYYRIDIWFPTKEEALNFGVHYNVPIEIVD